MNLFPDGSAGKDSAYSARDTGDANSISGLGRSPLGGDDNSLQYPCLENPMNRGAWVATVKRVLKSLTWLRKQGGKNIHVQLELP